MDGAEGPLSVASFLFGLATAFANRRLIHWGAAGVLGVTSRWPGGARVIVGAAFFVKQALLLAALYFSIAALGLKPMPVVFGLLSYQLWRVGRMILRPEAYLRDEAGNIHAHRSS